MQTYIVPGGLLNERGGAVVADEVMVAPPSPGEVRVRVRASSLCHTDLTASRDAPAFRCCLDTRESGSLMPSSRTPSTAWRTSTGCSRPCAGVRLSGPPCDSRRIESRAWTVCWTARGAIG